MNCFVAKGLLVQLMVAVDPAANGSTNTQAPVDLPPVAHVAVTENFSLVYHSDNRNTQPGRMASYLDDSWGMAHNRLNTQASWKGLRLGLRLDTVVFYTYPSPAAIGMRMLGTRPGGGSESDTEYFQTHTKTAATQLINRYIHWTYPAKWYVEYASRRVDISLGDFNSQLGRGFVLSARKMDELASDITVRGARLVARIPDFRGYSVEVTILGGELNPLRIDEPSGRYLGITRGVTQGYLRVLESGMPHAITSNYVTTPIPTYAPDQVVAGQIVLSLPLATIRMPTVILGSQASYLTRQTTLSPGTDATLSRDGQRILTASQLLEIPGIASIADLYVEAASQQLRSHTMDDRNGYAIYASLGVHPRPLAFTFAGKHYRRMSALLANINTQFAPEFQNLQASAPPSTLPIWADYETGTYNLCTTGGRGKVDWMVRDGLTAFGWLGRYSSWSALENNPTCSIDADNRTSAWDVAVGMEIAWSNHRSHARWTLGGRDDHADRKLPKAVPPNMPALQAPGDTPTYYQEAYLRYDVVLALPSKHALHFEGWHRRRERPMVLARPWYEGIHTTGLDLSRDITLAMGFEFTTEPAFPPTYLNLFAQWRITSASMISLLVGQRRGSIRCVGGVCRNYPPFEGARLDGTWRW